MQTQAYFILLLLRDYPLPINKLKEELLQSLYFEDSEDVSTWIETLTLKNWIKNKSDIYFVTQTGLKELLNRESLNPVRYNSIKSK